MAKRIKAVLFDMDGLVFDTERVYWKKWAVASKMFGYQITDDQIFASMGASKAWQQEYFKELFGPSFSYDTVMGKIEELIVADVVENGPALKKGFNELIAFLKEKNIKTALATSTKRWRTETYLKIAGMMNTFDAVICGDDVTHSKPAPDIFLKAANTLEIAPGDCMVLEDSRNGIIAAHNAGMIPVCIPDMKQPTEDMLDIVYKVLPSLDKVIDEIE